MTTTGNLGKRRDREKERQRDKEKEPTNGSVREKKTMVSWLEVFLMILFVASLADAATRRSKSSPNAKLEFGS